MCRAGSLTAAAAAAAAAARELARCKLDLVGVQEVGWDKGGTVRREDYNFLEALSYLIERNELG